MKSLIEIVETGTPSERALAKLCQLYPINQGQYLSRHRVRYGIGTGLAAAACGASLDVLITTPATALLSIPAALLMGLWTAWGVEELAKNRRAGRASEPIPSQEHSFYRLGDGFVTGPSPAAEALGSRVYPIDHSYQLQQLPAACVFFGDVLVSTTFTEQEYWQDVGGEFPARAKATKWIGKMTASRDGECFSIHVETTLQSEARALEQLSSRSYSIMAYKSEEGMTGPYLLFDEQLRRVNI